MHRSATSKQISDSDLNASADTNYATSRISAKITQNWPWSWSGSSAASCSPTPKEKTFMATSDKIAIQGYKSFKDFELSLNRINILVGANGAGKSNFLSFFEFLNALYEQRLTEYVSLRGGTARFLFEGPKVTRRIFAELTFCGNLYSFTIEEGAGRFVFTHERVGHTSDSNLVNSDEEIATLGNESVLRDYNGQSNWEDIKSYLSGIRKYHFHDTGKTSPFTHTCNIDNDKYFLYSNGGNISAFLYNIKKKHPITYKKIVMTIRSVAPYFNDFYFNANENGDIRLQWRDRYSETIYGPTDFSDGSIRFIALTTLFLQPEPPKVIVIDEPELGLHPFAISKLAGLIRSVAQKGSQIIMATQSAELISNFEPEDIITVNQDRGASAMQRLDSLHLANWLNDYTLGDLWKQNILKGGQPR